MSESPISRAFSLSSGGSTLVGSNASSFDPKAIFSPVISIGPDNRQWIDLEYVSPKLLRELRRQSALSSGYDQPSSISKGAAKVKAWIRRGHRGIDIRLRRPTGPDRDEITDICLIPHDIDVDDHKPPIPELAEDRRPIYELSGESAIPELPQESDHRRTQHVELTPIDDETLATHDPVPTYESREGVRYAADEHPMAGIHQHEHENQHGRSSSASSIMPTPARGLSVRKYSFPDDESKSKLDDIRQRLMNEQQSRQHFQLLLEALQRKLSVDDGASSNAADENMPDRPILDGLKVADTARYETETDVEPPSPSERVVNREPAEKAKPQRSPQDLLMKANLRTRKASRARSNVLRDPSTFTSAKPRIIPNARRRKVSTLSFQEPALSSGDEYPDPAGEISENDGVDSVETRPAIIPKSTSSKPTKFEVRVSKPDLPTITTTFHPASKEPSPVSANPVSVPLQDTWFDSWRPPHQPRSDYVILGGIMFASITKQIKEGIEWLERNYGPEPAVAPNKVRVRWTCSCGEQLYDEFIEKRPGAARQLEAYLNRPRRHAGSHSNPTTPSSASGSHLFSSVGGPPSSQTSWASYGSPNRGVSSDKEKSKSMPIYAGMPMPSQSWPPAEPPWLLTCANEDRYTPKLAHLDMAPHKVTSDKDLALALRQHYFHINRTWWRSLRLRGLTTIEFVQLEVHQNRFADIRKCPDMPVSTQDYDFEAGDLMPPVGSRYLLHLFRHPEDYDGELITYLRSPKKKTGRLSLGVGWGINLVEGFDAPRVWMAVSCVFTLASLVFGVTWTVKRHDVQGAFGVAGWICTVAILVIGWAQSCLG